MSPLLTRCVVAGAARRRARDRSRRVRRRRGARGRCRAGRDGRARRRGHGREGDRRHGCAGRGDRRERRAGLGGTGWRGAGDDQHEERGDHQPGQDRLAAGARRALRQRSLGRSGGLEGEHRLLRGRPESGIDARVGLLALLERARAWYVAQVVWAGRRHISRCFASDGSAAGCMAAHWWSRVGERLRQPPPSPLRYGHTWCTTPGEGSGHRRSGSPWGSRLGGASPVAVIGVRIRPLVEMGVQRHLQGVDAMTSGARRLKCNNPGDDLFSRKAALSVSSALESLTSVFGMGTGVASPLESPGLCASGR